MIHAKLEEFLSNGWTLEFNLHNHNFFINSKKYRGAIAPSIADSGLYKMEVKNYGLKKAVVTNGFHSVELETNLIEKLETSN